MKAKSSDAPAGKVVVFGFIDKEESAEGIATKIKRRKSNEKLLLS